MINLTNDNITKVDSSNSILLYKAIQDYNTAAIRVANFQTLLDLTIDSFAQIFQYSDAMILEYVKQDASLYPIAYQGFQTLDAIQPISFPIDKLKNQENSFTRCSNPELTQYFDVLQVFDPLICPIFKCNGQFYGFILCANSTTNDFEQSFDLETFTSLSHQAGFYINNYRTNEQLRVEIKERRLAEQKIAEQTAALTRSNEDLQQFAYVISHDLKAPLRNITSFAQLLEHCFPDDLNGDAKEYLNFVLTGVKQLGNLIDDLLVYSRASEKPVDVEDVEFDLIVETVKYNLNIAIQENNAVIEYDELPTFSSCFNQMTLLFQNLVSNAIKFRQEDKTPIIKINSQPYDDKHTLFTVSDNGIGIEEEYFTRIFSLFQRLHRQDEFEGTGLGLSICKKIIERNHGKIWVESKGLNQGTTFFVLLPH